jgi:ribonuclease J
MYEWVRPRAAVPAHGEAHHLTRHAAFAKEQGVSQVVSARNGDLVRLAPGAPAVIGKIPFGRVFKDGDILVSENDGALRERVKLAFAGVVSIALAVGKQGDLVGDPDIVFAGLPKLGKNNVDMGDVVDDAVFKTFDTLPRARRRDFDSVATAIERAVRGAVYASWGKKPLVHVLVVGG